MANGTLFLDNQFKVLVKLAGPIAATLFGPTAWEGWAFSIFAGYCIAFEKASNSNGSVSSAYQRLATRSSTFGGV
jgi:hypothetical protein